MAFLMDTLEAYRLGDHDAEDEWIWVPDKAKGFWVKSLYRAWFKKAESGLESVLVNFDPIWS